MTLEFLDEWSTENLEEINPASSWRCVATALPTQAALCAQVRPGDGSSDRL